MFIDTDNVRSNALYSLRKVGTMHIIVGMLLGFLRVSLPVVAYFLSYFVFVDFTLAALFLFEMQLCAFFAFMLLGYLVKYLLVRYAFLLSRDRAPRLLDMIKLNVSPFKVIGLGFMSFILPYWPVILLVALSGFYQFTRGVFPVVVAIAGILVIFRMTMRSFNYVLSFFLLAEYPHMSITDCLNRSRELMTGIRSDYFQLRIHYYLPGNLFDTDVFLALPAGLLYRMTTVAYLYNKCSGYVPPAPVSNFYGGGASFDAPDRSHAAMQPSPGDSMDYKSPYDNDRLL